jgi:SAM-dependent methyltransferase
MSTVSFDPVWEEKYSAGHQERAPWDNIVSFIYRYRPRGVPHSNVKILEVGCGVANNLYFAASEGFDVSGVDGSKSAIGMANTRFQESRLKGDLRVGDFSSLPFSDSTFDLAIDRAALTCAGTGIQIKAIAEIHRCLKLGGHFIYTPYACDHDSFKNSSAGADDVRVDIRKGTLQGVGQIRFLSEPEIAAFLPPDKWDIKEKVHTSEEDRMINEGGRHAAWKIIVRKK